MAAFDDANRQLLRRGPLLKAAVEFFALPARYIHPDHLPRFGFDDLQLFARLVASPRGERRLSDLIARRAELPSDGGFQFAEDRLRIALLPFPVIERLFSFAAAASLRRELAMVVERSSRARLDAAMGADAREFAHKEAAATLGPLATDHWGPPVKQDLVARFENNRSRCLEGCMAEAPAAMTQRLKLKLPASWDCDFSDPPPAQHGEAAWRMARRLLRTKIPEGGALCFA